MRTEESGCCAQDVRTPAPGAAALRVCDFGSRLSCSSFRVRVSVVVPRVRGGRWPMLWPMADVVAKGGV
eukprot:3669932-Prymnesium_polylepis.3